MRTYPMRLPAALASLLLLAGCGAGDPTYYRLATWPGAPHPTGTAIAIAVHAPNVASYLDRDYIVESVTDYRLHLAGNDAWAEPIGDMLGRTLTADLAQRLPDDRISGDAGLVRAPDATVDLDVSSLDRDGHGTALLRGTITLRDAAGVVLRSEKLDLAAPGTGPGSAAFAAAESRLLGDAADRAAGVLAVIRPAIPADAASSESSPSG